MQLISFLSHNLNSIISPSDISKPQQFACKSRWRNNHYVMPISLRSSVRSRIPVPSAIAGHAPAKRATKRAKKATLLDGFALFSRMWVSQGGFPRGVTTSCRHNFVRFGRQKAEDEDESCSLTGSLPLSVSISLKEEDVRFSFASALCETVAKERRAHVICDEGMYQNKARKTGRNHNSNNCST